MSTTAAHCVSCTGLPLDGLAVDRAAIDRLGLSLLATLAALDRHELAGALFGAAIPASQAPNSYGRR